MFQQSNLKPCFFSLWNGSPDVVEFVPLVLLDRSLRPLLPSLEWGQADRLDLPARSERGI